MTANHFHPFERGVVITGEPSREDWQVYFAGLKKSARSLPHQLGDMLVYGEITYGDISQDFDEDDFCNEPILRTAYNYKYVAQAWWPPERKVYNVPWSWYQATASLPPHEQDEVMVEALEFTMSRDQLRGLVAAYHKKAGRRIKPPTYPDDKLFETEQENYALRNELDTLKNTRTREGQIIVPEIDELSKPLINWLGQVGYSSIIVYSSGRIVIKP